MHDILELKCNYSISENPSKILIVKGADSKIFIKIWFILHFTFEVVDRERNREGKILIFSLVVNTLKIIFPNDCKFILKTIYN